MPAKSGQGGADVPGAKTNEREGTRAVLRHSRMSASKVRQVLDLIRGQDVDRAAEILSLGDREAAVTVGKVLASAVANAVHNDGLDAEELFVSACYADEGSTLKRWRPRARGRATRIRKRTSHITVIVGRLPDDRIARRRAQQAATGSQRSRRVAGSRRRQRAETAESTTVPEDHDTGAEAWSEDAVHADDLVTETEAGPLEESDFDGEGPDAEGDDEAEATDGSEATGEAEETDTTDETDADDGADGDGADDETDGGSAGEKDK
ncbi:MAG: 50S ribosomal protein L22 [Acidimicrobiales bacterium]|nr:50S ribosomal protein L22 [Acidimicrobiales bacterium]